MHVDHVIWKVDDLDAGAADIAATYGIAEGGGGRHKGIGTHNRVFPLGDCYLEVLAVIDPEEAQRSPLGQAIVAAPPGLFGWCVAVEDARPHAARLGVGLMEVARDDLTARLAGVEEAAAEPPLPFFIERHHEIGGDAGGIAWLEVAGDPTRMRTWLDGADLPLRFVDGEPGVRALGLGNGTVLR